MLAFAKQNQDFRRLILASALVDLGDSALMIVVAFWLQDVTGSNSVAAFALAAQAAPALVAPVMGLLADRFSRRRTLVLSNLVGAVNYEASEDTPDEVAAALLSQIEWHPYERAYRCFAR